MVEYNRQPGFDNKSYWKGREDERNNGDHSHYLLDEAVKEIESLKQRAEQAEKERDELKKTLFNASCAINRGEMIFNKFDDVCKGLVEERDKLQAIVDKLPKTMDGVGIMPDTTLYHWYDYNGVVRLDEIKVGPEYQLIVCINGCWQPAHINMWCCYSTKQAAEEAKKEGE